MTALFHVDVFMPAHLAKPCHRGRLQYTRHAVREATNDRYGHFPLVFNFIPEQATLIETEAEGGPNGPNSQVVKQLWRIPVDAERDVVMAILPGGLVKTCWINERSDQHKTLNRARYVPQRR